MKIMVLNLLYRSQPYTKSDIRNISQWISFFQSKGLHVIATPPRERQEVFNTLSVPTRNLLTPYAVLSFDTCDRWHFGFEKALELGEIMKDENHEYIYLWSADFDFDNNATNAASQLLEYNGDENLVVGTIQTFGRKSLIDECATYKLLQCWFPEEYKIMVKEGFNKPRSEILRLSSKFLERALTKRWFPTEQTIYLILQCLWEGKSIISLPFDTMRDDEDAKLSPNVVEQVERMELWFKYIWRDHNKEWDKLEYILKSLESSNIVTRAYRNLLYG